MASKFFERRSFRNQLKTYLETKGWVNLEWAEGFSSAILPTIIPPFISVFIDDLGKDELELGADPTINKIFSRRAQVDVYMESEDRVSAITDDISDFMDIEAIVIKDNASNTIGSMISSTSSIISDVFPPDLNEQANLDWRGSTACLYDVHYPLG